VKCYSFKKIAFTKTSFLTKIVPLRGTSPLLKGVIIIHSPLIRGKSEAKGVVIILKKIFRLFWLSCVAFLLLSVSLVLFYRFVPPPVTPLMLTRTAGQLLSGKSPKLNYKWTPIEKISSPMQLAVMCSEDQKFNNHNGFDFEAIEKAIEYNETHKKTRGASTISQQTTKNLFLWPGRDWIRKGLESYFTILIETFWSKERIMEVYLNVIETGDGIYGCESAANEYFNKSASHLSRNESALIAAILPNPRIWSCINITPRTKSRQSWILRQMSYYGNDMSYE
jgi:monofunctional biosynthetic peptidoglycan transglycosylase